MVERLPASISFTCVMSMCACTTKQKPKAPRLTYGTSAPKPSYIYSVTGKRFISMSLSSTNDWNLGANTHTLSSNMYSGSWNSKKHSSFVVLRQQQKHKQQQKKPHVSMTLTRKRLRLRRRELRRAGAEMEMVNLKLYLENRCILAENERLRERASALRRENLALRANLCKTAAVLPAAGAGAGSGC